MVARTARPFVVAAVAVFSMGCAASTTMSSAASPSSAPSDAVRLRLRAGGHEAWSLRDAKGKHLCTLPCEAWVPPNSGYHLQIDKYGADDETTTLAIPDELPARAGESLDVHVDRTHGLGGFSKWLSAPLGVVFGLGGVGSTSLGIAGLLSPGTPASTSVDTTACAGTDITKACTGSSTRTEGTAASVGATVIGVALLAISVTCWVWFAHDRDAGIQFSPSAGRAAPTRPLIRFARAWADGGFSF